MIKIIDIALIHFEMINSIILILFLLFDCFSVVNENNFNDLSRCHFNIIFDYFDVFMIF